MKALSIRQPWAWLIVNAYKDIENRTWSTDFRGRVYVHAGKRVKPGDFPKQRDYIREYGLILPEEPPWGAIIGDLLIRFESDRYGDGFVWLRAGQPSVIEGRKAL